TFRSSPPVDPPASRRPSMVLTQRATNPLTLIALLCAASAAAQEQPAPAPTPAPVAEPSPPAPVPTPAPAEATAPRQALQEELVVTGSRIRRKDLTTPAPVTVISRLQFEQSGKLTIGDYLQSLPEQGNAPNFQVNTGGINYDADGTTKINLRSLG